MVFLSCSNFQIAILTSFFTAISAYMVGNDPYNRIETLDKSGKYQLEWLVDWNLKRVTFKVAAETTGYVGFGLSVNGKMSGADIVIGGVSSNGNPYFMDYHAVAHQVPERDATQNWVLNEAFENNTHTFLSFFRSFDTGDTYDDYLITEDKITLIWSYGERDEPLKYHFKNRGSYDVYLIHPDYTPYIEQGVGGKPMIIGDDTQSLIQEENAKVWSIHRRMRIPSSHTTYWCTMHAAPRLPQKQHVIGIDIRFDNDETRSHVHHIQINRCTAPTGQNAKSVFQPFVQHRGQLCYQFEAPTGPIPTEYCTHIYHGLGLGSRSIFNPPHVGLPFGQSPDEYYVLQVHYDNPQRKNNLTVDLTVDLYYTSQLRTHDGGFLAAGHIFPGLPPSILVPPSSPNHLIRGECGESCTRSMLPPEGIRIFAISPHSHNSGRRMMLQHFRGGQELPVLTQDNNYSFAYQQFRVLNGETLVLPGDHLVMNCEYDNTWSNGSTVGGYSTSQEMCVAFLLYYNKMDYSACISEIISVDKRSQFLAGVRNVTWNQAQLDYVVDPPQTLAGLTTTQVSDHYSVWNLDTREELQRFHKRHPHTHYCLI